MHVSERRACAALGRRRSARYRGAVKTKSGSLPTPIALARQYGRYGYREDLAGLLEQAGWLVNDKRVERILAARGAEGPP